MGCVSGSSGDGIGFCVGGEVGFGEFFFEDDEDVRVGGRVLGILR